MEKINILICDDNIIDRLFIKRILKKKNENYLIDEVSDSEALYSAVKKKKYDVLLLDSILPAADGVDVCRELRGMGVEIKIILISGREYDEVYKDKAVSAGADYYFTKPVDVKNLENLLNSLN